MAHVFMARCFEVPEAGPVSVTITGTGNSSNCYATINGTTYSAEASGIEVLAGDVITFGVKGAGGVGGVKSTITIDGETVVSTSAPTLSTYDYTVPEGISTISIVFSNSSASSFSAKGPESQNNGVYTITVTTA